MSSFSYFLHTKPSLENLSCLLLQCRVRKNLKDVKKIHAQLLRTGLIFMCHPELILTHITCLDKNSPETVTSFLKCLKPTNPLPFNVLVSNFCRNGLQFLALKSFSFMHMNGVPLDTYALCSSLSASSSVKDGNFGKQIHGYMFKSGWSCSVFLGSALIESYSKSALINDAARVFDEIPMKNTVCANALLSGYVEATLWAKGLEFVKKMPILKLECDQFTLSAALSACAGLSATEMGKQLHGFLLRTVDDVERDVFLQSTLTEMYGKGGMVNKAWQVFQLAGVVTKGETQRDIVLWTSMLNAYSRNGLHGEVIALYKEMLNERIRPDEVAFVTVMSACVHTGQMQLGIKYFESMVDEFKLEPGPEHYSCLVDLLCRAGELDKAWEILNKTLLEGKGNCSVSMCGSLLRTCLESGNVVLGKLAAERALELEPENDGIYVMLSNLYAKFGMWDEIGHLRVLMKEKGLRKDIGCSWIQVHAKRLG